METIEIKQKDVKEIFGMISRAAFAYAEDGNLSYCYTCLDTLRNLSRLISSCTHE